MFIVAYSYVLVSHVVCLFQDLILIRVVCSRSLGLMVFIFCILNWATVCCAFLVTEINDFSWELTTLAQYINY